MKRADFEKLGDLHKKFESRLETNVMSGSPVIIRLDGRSFHTFCKNMNRPYDQRMTSAMIDTTKYLVASTQANVGYVASDEITLAYRNDDVSKEMMFSGRIQKLCSIVASMATAKFNQIISTTIPEKANLLPVFDARVFQYPTLDLAAETFLWRETDATRNSLTMAAHTYYSNTDLHKAGFTTKHNMLHAKGVNWNNYPPAFKRGTYVAARKSSKMLTDEELVAIPIKHRPIGAVIRNEVIDLDLPPYTTIANPIDVLFYGAEVVVK